MQRLWQSPLSDSNRRPPPYHFRGHARAHAITRDTVFPANQVDLAAADMSRDVARVVSDVAVLCPRLVVYLGNTPLSLVRRETISGDPGVTPGYHRACARVSRVRCRSRRSRAAARTTDARGEPVAGAALVSFHAMTGPCRRKFLVAARLRSLCAMQPFGASSRARQACVGRNGSRASRPNRRRRRSSRRRAPSCGLKSRR
jgi:hypothetical protein